MPSLLQRTIFTLSSCRLYYNILSLHSPRVVFTKMYYFYTVPVPSLLKRTIFTHFPYRLYYNVLFLHFHRAVFTTTYYLYTLPVMSLLFQLRPASFFSSYPPLHRWKLCGRRHHKTQLQATLSVRWRWSVGRADGDLVSSVRDPARARSFIHSAVISGGTRCQKGNFLSDKFHHRPTPRRQ